MITDAYNTVTATASALASGSSVFSSDAIDLRSSPTATNAGDIGEGTELYATLWVASTFTGGGASGTIDIGFATDAAGTGFAAIASTGAVTVASGTLSVGLPGSSGTAIHGYLLSVRIQPLRAGNYNPYLLVRITASGAALTGAARLQLTLEPIDGRVFYPSGFSVK